MIDILTSMKMKLLSEHEKEVTAGLAVDPALLADDNLARFLRCRKLNMEYAMNTFLNYIKFKQDHPEWFENLSAEVGTEPSSVNHRSFVQ